MYSTKELNGLVQAIRTAKADYINAVRENLQECGRTLNLHDDAEDDEENHGLRVSVLNRHDELVTAYFDGIRTKGDAIICHCCLWDDEESDFWYPLDNIADDDTAFHIFENIEWNS